MGQYHKNQSTLKQSLLLFIIFPSVLSAVKQAQALSSNRRQLPVMSLAASRGSSSSTTSSSMSWPQMERPVLMGEDERQVQPNDQVIAIMNYVSTETTVISTRRDLGGGDSTLVGAIWDPTQVNVHNARSSKTAMNLDVNGFQLQRNEDNDIMGMLQEIDFCDQDDVVDTYYPMCEQLVADCINKASTITTPIAYVSAFDHNVRSNDHSSVGKIKPSSHMMKDGGSNTERSAPQVQNPAGIVHADYTVVSAPRRLHDLSNPPKLNDVLRPKLICQNRKSLLDPNVVQEALNGKRRYAFINVWRSIDKENPVKDAHLACIDSLTVGRDELRTFQIHYTDRVGENYFVCPSSNDIRHSWYYYPDMTLEEALLIKQWDSCGDIADGSKRSTFAIHSAFLDPTAPKDAPSRKSIEVRVIVIWDKNKNCHAAA